MKKTLGVISLFVLMSVQILTPIAYAVGDEDFITEATVEETVTEDVVEATDDVEEVSEEVTEEDVVSDETTGEDSSEEDTLDEEIEALENAEESEDSNSEGEEVSTGASVESNTEEVPVLSEEDEAFIAKLSKQGSVAKIAEELGINWYTDSSEYAVLAGIEGDYYGTKEQNNIIREYLIEHAFELLKKTTSEETVEDVSTENAVEETISEEVELTGLNEEEISGKKYYNGVTVNVLAPAKSFPEGTTLSITPIKKKNELKEIKEQLVESQEEVTEDSTVVAFDISFLYSGEEVQPVTGQTVQVTFNYENHEKLSDAEQDEEKELKVYHLNDKDEEGNKVENISDVTVEEVEIVSNEEGELVVDAESFSIYTIVTQVAEEGPEATEDQLANFVYGEISIARPDSYVGEGPLGFTIMDRNLGARTTGIGSEASTGSYGYYYQWGNNYGFSPYKNIETSDLPVEVPGNEYKSGTFITTSDYSWMNPLNNNLWKLSSQGPCPTGWHVPTASERSLLLNYYVLYYQVENHVVVDIGGPDYTSYNQSGPSNGFFNYFKIPFAGFLTTDLTLSLEKEYVNLRTSTPLFDEEEYVYSFIGWSTNTSLDGDSFNREGMPVRCFKDTYSGTGDTFTVTYEFNGGSGSTAEVEVLSGEKAKQPTEPIKSGYVFDGWYTNSGENDNWGDKFNFNKTSITSNRTLYAKWLSSNEATILKTGKEFNAIIKTLANGGVDKEYIESDENIEHIVRWNDGSDLPDDKVKISLDGYTDIYAWYNGDNKTIYYYTTAEKIYLNKDSTNMFWYLQSLLDLDVSNFVTSKVQDMSYMFGFCISLESLNLSSFDISNVGSIEGMFLNNSSLMNLNLDGWNWSNVSSFSSMFNGASALKELSLRGWKIPEAFMSAIGGRTSVLTAQLDYVDVSDWDLSDTNNLYGLFGNYNGKEIRGLETWDISNVLNMYGMFQNALNITWLNLTSFDTRKVQDMTSMFEGDSNLRTIYASENFSLESAGAQQPFQSYANLNKLVGGNGTIYNNNNDHGSYTRIDNENQTGYFTDPSHFAIRFKTQDGEEIATQWIATGGTAQALTGRYMNYDYYTGADLEHEYDLNTPLYAYTEIYASGINAYEVKFYSGDELLYTEYVTGDNQSKLSIPEAPIKEGYDFVGWYRYSLFDLYDFDSIVSSNFNLHAYWEDPKEAHSGTTGCYGYSTSYDNGEYLATITQYNKDGSQCNGVNVEIPNVIVRNGREYKVTSIGSSAFSQKLSGSLVLPQNLKTIGSSAFYGCSNLTSVEINDGLQIIGQFAFQNAGLTSLSIPNSVLSIENSAFQGNANMETLEIEDGMNELTIGNMAFMFDGIKELELPNSVRTLGTDAFNGCSSLESVIIGDGLTVLNTNIFANCTRLESVVIGDGVTTLGSSFNGDTNLKSITWGSNVETINGGAFDRAGLEEIEIPATVINISSSAFTNNPLTKVSFLGNSFELGSNAFCSDTTDDTGSIIGVVSGATTEQITSLEAQDNTACLVLKKDKYELTYNAGAHSGKVDGLLTTGVIVDYSGTVQLAGNGAKTAVSDKGYTFLGWTDEEGKKTTINSILLDEDKVVYPVFKDTISATFKGNNNLLNGGEEEITLSCDRYNNDETCEVTVPSIRENLNTPIVRGYTVASGTGSTILSLSGIQLTQENISGNNLKVTISSNVVGYAQTFAPAITYNVVYKKGEGVTSITNITANSCTIAATYNGVEQLQYCTVTAPTIETNNSLPGNWGYYNNGTSIKAGDPIQIYGDQTLVAFSEGVNYTISYNMDGGAWKQGAVFTGTYQEGESFDLPTNSAVVKTGYTFKGWIDATTQQPVTQITSSDQTSKVFNATWRKDNYRIIYDNIGYDVSLPTTYNYDNSVSIPNLENGRYGYTFKGWTYEGQSTPKKNVTLQAVEGVFEGDIELRANWEAKGYTITYDLKGGTLPIGKSNPTNYTVDSGDIELVNPERSGSVFEGWIASGMTLPVGVVIIPRGSVGNRSYTASYTCMEGYTQNNNECIKETYNVTYQDQHTYTPLQETVQVGGNGEYVIPVKNPSYQGYVFNGWKANVSEYKCVDGNNNELSVCKANGNNTVYIVFDRGQNVTLTAEWTHRDVTITLYNRTSSNSSESITKDYNGSISLIAGDVAGYKVIGWSTGANVPKLYTDGISIDVSEIPNIQCSSVETESCSASLYVLREVKEYKIIYDLNDGDSNDLENPATLTFNQVPFILKPATRVGYDFDGWRYEGNKVEQITAAMLEDNSATEKINLRAGWLPSINTQYLVYHVKESLNGTYETGNTALTEIFTGYGITGAPKTPAVRTYVGFDSPQQDSLSIGADGKSYLIYEYTRNKRSYTFNTVVGAITNGTTPTNVNMYYEAPIVLSGKAEIGYSWSGWMIHSGTTDIFVPVEDTPTSNHLYEFTMPLNDVIVEPVVYHIPYTLRYNVNGGTGNESELQEVSPIYYDSGITYPVVTRMGYSFSGWYDDNGTVDETDDVYYGSGNDVNNKKMPNGNLNLVAHWSANPFVLKVNHYQMDLTGNYPAQPTNEVSINTTIDADITSGNNSNILPETYTGFTLSGDAVESIHINPDGTTKIDYYYIRDKHNVTVNTNEGVTLSGTLSGSYYYQTPVSVEAIINEGYTWSGWNVTSGENEPVFTTDTGVAFILGTGNVILTPLTTTNSYHLTIKNDGTLVFSGDVLYKTNISQYLTTPSKAGYTFNGWSNRPVNDLMPAKDLVIEAKWTYKSNGGGGGGGGGSSSSDDKKVIINNTGDKQQEHSSADLTGTNLTGTNKDLKENEVKEEQPEKAITDMNFDELKNLSADKLKKVDRTKLTKEENEILDAYEWAYEHNVTTMVTLNDANPEGVVTRGHLAKMVVNYAINVLGQQLPEKVPSECRWNDWRGDWESDEIKDYAVKACSLGLMGLDMKKFSPKLRVTRAQFGTIMSRLLWGKKYAGGTPYYRKHLNALKENNIMTQIGNPEGRVELRQWVWLMLMRAAMDKNA